MRCALEFAPGGHCQTFSVRHKCSGAEDDTIGYVEGVCLDLIIFRRALFFTCVIVCERDFVFFGAGLDDGNHVRDTPRVQEIGLGVKLIAGNVNEGLVTLIESHQLCDHQVIVSKIIFVFDVALRRPFAEDGTKDLVAGKALASVWAWRFKARSR